MGASVGEIRLPNTAGIAGAVFTTGHAINIPYAYADLRFNPAFDKRTGYFTRSILCVPIVNKNGKTIGVTQVLNKKGGPFTGEDEKRLKVFTAQLAISLENAKLFDDIQNMKNYNEGVLQSMSNGVVTLNEEGRIVTCNRSGLRILRMGRKGIVEASRGGILRRPERLGARAYRGSRKDAAAGYHRGCGTQGLRRQTSVNLTVLPLMTEAEIRQASQKAGHSSHDRRCFE